MMMYIIVHLLKKIKFFVYMQQVAMQGDILNP